MKKMMGSGGGGKGMGKKISGDSSKIKKGKGPSMSGPCK
jgi:hypothetical protein